MSHHGHLADYRFGEDVDDVRGATLYGRDDEKLGKIDDVIFDHSTGSISYVVVDTGGWLSTKKFVVPPDRVHASPERIDNFGSDLTKEQIESLPPYDEGDLASGEKWAGYQECYRAKWEEHPVMHRAETDRNITPTTQQLEGNRSSLEAEARANRERKALQSTTRWSQFQQRVCDQRERIVAGCTTCRDAIEAAPEKSTPGTLKRAG